MDKFLCPCCGNLTLEENRIGSFEICPVCFWENDNIQFDDPNYEGGANKVSLNQARQNYKKFGASDKSNINDVRSRYNCEIPLTGTGAVR